MPDTRVLHVSDLHAGADDNPEADQALSRLTERLAPSS